MPEYHDIFCLSVNLFVTLLTAIASDLGNGHALDADFIQRFLNLIQFEGLNDCFYFFS